MTTEIEALRAQVEAAEAEADALRAEAKNRAEVAELRARLEEAAHVKRDAPAIAKAEAELGAVGRSIAVVTFPLGSVVVKTASLPSMKRFWKRTQGGQDITPEAAEELVRACLVYPEADRLTAIFEDSVTSSIRLASEIIALKAARDHEVKGKS